MTRLINRIMTLSGEIFKPGTTSYDAKVKFYFLYIVAMSLTITLVLTVKMLFA